MKKTVTLVCALLFAVSAAVTAQKTLRIVTINVWSGLTYQGVFKSGAYESKEERLFRYGLLVNALRELDADIIGVNEANMLPGYAKKLARDLGYDYIYAVRFGGVRLGQAGFPINLREGHVILAKKYLNLMPAGSRGISGGYAGNFASFHFEDTERVLAGKITVGEDDVFLFCAQWHESEFAGEVQLKTLVDLYAGNHLEGSELLVRMRDAVNGRRERMAEAVKTVQFISEVAGDHAVVLMGSLNALSASEEIKVLEDAGFKDAWDAGRGEGFTRDGVRNMNIIRYFFDEASGEKPGRDRVDYIFYRGEGVSASKASIALDETTYEIHPSDHFAVTADLKF
ncbi:MAG: endonuclease/exonuclease/phosphatase family protein [Spirochaetales bacterium]|nr:endonuclease/exonuclease/phosphatase family protein [Spirochaetales bacterium]